MANKRWLLPLLLALAAPARGELLKLSLLSRPAPRFTLRLDIFQGSGAAAGLESGRPGPAAANPGREESLQRSIAEEIAQSVSFEGFIVKNARKSALLNVSGDFFVAGEGDVILEKIKVLKISRDLVTIEYDGQPYDIRRKGE